MSSTLQSSDRFGLDKDARLAEQRRFAAQDALAEERETGQSAERLDPAFPWSIASFEPRFFGTTNLRSWPPAPLGETTG